MKKALITSAIILIGLLGYWLYIQNFTVLVKIENQTSHTFENAVLATSDKNIIWTGKVNPTARKTMRFIPKSEGSLRLRGTLNGQSLDSGGFGYITSYMDGRYELIITDENIHLEHPKYPPPKNPPNP